MLQGFRALVGQNRIWTSILVGVPFFVFTEPTYPSIRWGLPFLILGELIRILSSGFIRKNSELTENGPYSVVRNPLYVGNFFLCIGFLVMGNNVYLALVYLVFFGVIYDAAIKEEEKILLKRFGQRYREYMARVPRFIPRGNPWNYFNGRFCWSLVNKKRELNICCIMTLGIWLLFLKILEGA